MKKINILVLLFTALILFTSCKDYVTNVEPLVDAVADSKLNNQAQVPFLIKGVETRFAFTMGQVMVLSGGLSDAFFFTKDVPNATYPTFADIDKGIIYFDNNSVAGAYTPLGQFRFFADNLIKRVNSIKITDNDLKNQALFTGYFYGGYARYLYATYFGLNPTEGGSPINNGPFIKSDKMYDLAISRFKTALTSTTDPYQIRMVNSVIARAYLFKGDYTNAATYAAKGLQQGDPPFQALHNQQQDNYWWEQAGALRAQYVAAPRFKAYIDSNAAEANRIKLAPVKGHSGKIYYYQVMDPTADSPQNVITWQENDLMLAELILRGTASGNALQLVNDVRASHQISPLTSVNLGVIYTERDKELFTTGARLPDERRFNKWHLGSGTWQYLPIPLRERNNNPNL